MTTEAIGIATELDRMTALAAGAFGAGSVEVQRAALSIVSGAEPAGYFAAISAWVDERVAYMADPCVSELLLSPARMLEEISDHGHCHGDGPDIAVLVAALSLAAGLDVQFVAVGFRGRPISHVFALAKTSDDIWSADPVAGKPFAGDVTESAVFPLRT